MLVRRSLLSRARSLPFPGTSSEPVLSPRTRVETCRNRVEVRPKTLIDGAEGRMMDVEEVLDLALRSFSAFDQALRFCVVAGNQISSNPAVTR